MWKILAGAAVVILTASQAHATLQITTGIFGGNQVTENVLYNQAGLQNDSFLVQGVTNQTGTIVDFVSTTALHTNGGQATITALGGGTFTNVDISLDNPILGFSKLIFNIDADANGFAHITTTDQFGTVFDFGNLALDGTGQNFFTIYSLDAQKAISTHIDTSVGIAAISDLEQVRIGAVERDPTHVPEPTTLALLGAG